VLLAKKPNIVGPSPLSRSLTLVPSEVRLTSSVPYQEGGQVAKKIRSNRLKNGRVARLIYSGTAFFVIGSAVAVLGAPIKWDGILSGISSLL